MSNNTPKTSQHSSDIFDILVENSNYLKQFTELYLRSISHLPSKRFGGDMAGKLRTMPKVIDNLLSTIQRYAHEEISEEVYNSAKDLNSQLKIMLLTEASFDNGSYQLQVSGEIVPPIVSDVNNSFTQLIDQIENLRYQLTDVKETLEERLRNGPKELSEAVALAEREKDDFYKSNISTLTNGHKQEIDSLIRRYTEDIDKLKNNHTEQIETTQKYHQDEIERLNNLRIALLTKEAERRKADLIAAKDDKRDSIKRISQNFKRYFQEYKAGQEDYISGQIEDRISSMRDIAEAITTELDSREQDWDSRFNAERSERLLALKELSTEAAAEITEKDSLAERVLRETWDVNALRMGQIKSYLDFLIQDQGIEVDYSNGRPEIIAEHTPQIQGLQDAIDSLYFLSITQEKELKEQKALKEQKPLLRCIHQLEKGINELYGELQLATEEARRRGLNEDNLNLQAAHYHERATYFGRIVSALLDSKREVVSVEGQEFVRKEYHDSLIKELECQRDIAIERETAANRTKARVIADHTKEDIDIRNKSKQIYNALQTFQGIIGDLPALIQDSGVTGLDSLSLQGFFEDKGITIGDIYDFANMVMIEERISQSESRLESEKKELELQIKDLLDQIRRYESRVYNQEQKINAQRTEMDELYNNIRELNDIKRNDEDNLLIAERVSTTLYSIVGAFMHTKIPEKDRMIAEESQKTKKARDQTDSMRFKLEETLDYVHELRLRVDQSEVKITDLETEITNSHKRERDARTLAFRQREHTGYLFNALEKYAQVFIDPPNSEEDLIERISEIQLTKDLISEKLKNMPGDENTKLYNQAYKFGESAEKILCNTLAILKDYKREQERRGLVEIERDKLIVLAEAAQTRVENLQQDILNRLRGNFSGELPTYETQLAIEDGSSRK